jgi:hypothetical protein
VRRIGGAEHKRKAIIAERAENAEETIISAISAFPALEYRFYFPRITHARLRADYE